MVRFFVLAVTLVYVSLSSAGAFDIQSRGITGSLSVSAFRSDFISNQNLQMNYAIGAFATTSLHPQVDLRTELFFSRKGAVLAKSKLVENGDPSDIKNETYLYYLELPILFSLKLNENYAIYGGGYGAYALGGWDERTQTLQREGRKTEIITKTEIQPDDVNNFDLGVVLGASLEYSWWRFDARYSAGLLKIYDDTDYLHMQIQLLFSILF